MDARADIMIIGAGIAGASLGAALAPHAHVILLEREAHAATHATGRSAAIYVRNYGNGVIRALNEASHAPLAEGGYLSPRGVMTVAREEDRAVFETEMANSTAEPLTPEEAVALFPLLRPEAAACAAIERGASDIDVDRLVQDHLRSLRAAGGQVVTGAGITGLAQSERGWEITWEGGSVRAPVVVNAAGAWADEVARMAGERPLGLVPYRRSAAILPMERDPSAWPMLLPARETWYAKPEAGQLMVSPAEEDLVAPMDAWADDMVIAEGLDRFARDVDFEVTRVSHSWAGLRTFAPDRTPVVGDTGRGFFWLAGQGGYGVQTSPAMAAVARDLILGRRPDLDPALVAALSPLRDGL